MSKIFVSYSRADEGRVNNIIEDMENLGHDVWFDYELSGGQNWWEKILQEIRQADIFVFILSPTSRKSSACSREYQYAHALAKPIVPLQVAEGISVNLLPPELSQIQIVDYLQTDRDAAFRLARSLSGISSFEPLPDPLPEPPAVPVSYVGTISQKIESSFNLSYEQQSVLLLDIKKCLRDSDVSETDAVVLLKEFRKRRDLLVSTAEEIDILLEKLERSEKEAEEKEEEEEAKKAEEAAELKAKQEVERKAKEAAELKTKQEKEDKAKIASELKAKQEAERKARETAKLVAEQNTKKQAIIPRYKGLAVAMMGTTLAVSVFVFTQNNDEPKPVEPQKPIISKPETEKTPISAVTAVPKPNIKETQMSVESKPVTVVAVPEQIPYEPDMITIPKGSFTMGCKKGRDDTEGDCDSDEKPEHKVTFAKAFKMGKYEITVEQYMACVDAKVCSKPAWKEKDAPSYYETLGKGLTADDYPIVGVSWDNAKTYAEWLSKETNKPYRLPTEAEWEYAARGGDNKLAFPWGKKASHEYANYGQDECCGGLKKGKDQWETTSPKGSFDANDYGLHDMHGNVWEWVEDRWHSNYEDKPPTDGSVAWESGDSSLRVIRGGSWLNTPRNLRSADRYGYSPASRINDLGFRLVSDQE